MPVPFGVPPELADYLAGLEDRLALLETPQGAVPAFVMASTSLSTINAAQNAGRWIVASDLKVGAYSDGSHWYNLSTGALIV